MVSCMYVVSLAVVSGERTSNRLGRFSKNRDIERLRILL